MYAVEPYPDVKDEIAALPHAACVGYREAVEVMGLVPWNGAPYHDDNPDGLMRLGRDRRSAPGDGHHGRYRSTRQHQHRRTQDQRPRSDNFTNELYPG